MPRPDSAVVTATFEAIDRDLLALETRIAQGEALALPHPAVHPAVHPPERETAGRSFRTARRLRTSYPESED